MRSLTNRPVGHERTLSKGITYIKYRESEFEDRFSGVSRFSQTYMDNRRYMYQMYHPNDVLTYDDSIVQVDGDRNNYGEDNLIKVPKCVSMRFSKMLRKHPNNTKDMNMAWIQIFSIDSELNKEEDDD